MTVNRTTKTVVNTKLLVDHGRLSFDSHALTNAIELSCYVLLKQQEHTVVLVLSTPVNSLRRETKHCKKN